jgi:hypothetical protein
MIRKTKFITGVAMRKYVSSLVMIVCCYNNALASEEKVHAPKEWKHQFYVGLNHARYHYAEPNITQNEYVPRWGALWMKDVGNMWGGTASYRLTWQEQVFIQPELTLLYGKHQYNFGRKDKMYAKTKHAISAFIIEPRLTLGINFTVYQGVTLSPYSGVGYRFKNDDRDNVRSSRGNKIGHYRKSNYVYIPLGASADYQLNETWSVSIKGEYDWIVKAWHYSRTPTTGAKTFKQPNGYGLKSDLSVSYLYNKINFSLTPYLNYWNIRNSNEINGGMEPYNITWETGLKLGVSF